MIAVQMGCCAFNEIRGLSDSPNATEAMRAFCRQVLATAFGQITPGAFFIFTAVIGTKDSRSPRGLRKPRRLYGDQFAAFIKKNKLGDVVVTMDRFNRKNVPTHMIRGWVWAPSEKNLRAWWRKNGGPSGR